MNSQRRAETILVAAFLWLAASTQAQVPQLINYQGQLTDANGDPASGTFLVRFSIFSTATGGTALYSEIQNVAVSNGVFNVLLGSVNPIPLNLFDGGTERYLEITVEDAVLTPRRRTEYHDYRISFLASFGAQPSVTVSPISTLAAIATVDAATSSSFVVRMFDSNGAAADRGFAFIAIGIP